MTVRNNPPISVQTTGMTPNISVIIRTIGRLSLRRAIESVEKQNRADIEIVVVAAAPDLVPVDSRVCAIHWLAADAALHPCVAANIGLATARGDYLIFLDDHDWLEPGHLEKLAAALEKSPEAVLAHTGVRMESENGECLARFDAPFEPWQLMAAPRFPIHAALFRRSAVIAGQCQFDVRFDVCEDWDFWLQLRKIGPFVHVPGMPTAYLHSLAGSGAHAISCGGEPCRKLWAKWGGLYDPSWLASLFEQVNQIPSLQRGEAALRTEVRQLTSKLADSQSRQQSLKAQLESVAGDLHAVLNSRTWRLTGPPRRLVERLRRFKRRVLGPPALPHWPDAIFPDPYVRWIAQYDTMTAPRRQEILADIESWQAHPAISVVMPVYDPPVQFLREAIDSVLAQIYPHWELCVADDASTDPKVREMLADYARRDSRIRVTYRPQNGHIVKAGNSALAIATGDFVALLDQDDLLSDHALFEVARAIRNHPGAGVIYSDEDRISDSGRRFSPCFKPDFNYEMLLGRNMMSHLGVYRRTLLQEIGGLKAGMEGAQDYDLVLRCIERLDPAQVIHIPKVLYHRRVHGGSTAASVDEKPDVLTAGVRAVNDHLERTCPGATAELQSDGCHYRIRFPLPSPAPKVSIIIPTRNAYELVRVCLSTLFEKTRYPDFEVIVVDNGSDEPALLDYLAGLVRAGKITVLRDDSPFNFAALNNRAVAQSAGEYVLLLNNDIEIIEPDWLAEMVSVAARPGVGAVGARLWYPDRTLQHGGVILGLGGVAGHAHYRLAAGHRGYFGRAVLLQCFSAVTAACLLIRRAIFDEVGGFDEKDLKVAYNDVDFCLKIVQAGYRNVWTPQAQLIHHESATRGNDLAPEKRDRVHSEVRFMRQKWGDLLSRDPAFNINLSLDDSNFVLGDAPRDQSPPQNSVAQREAQP